MVEIDWSASAHDDPAQNNGPQELPLINKLAAQSDDPLDEYRFVKAIVPEQPPNAHSATGFETFPRIQTPSPAQTDQLDGRYQIIRNLAVRFLNSENNADIQQALQQAAQLIQARGMHLSEAAVLNFNRNMVLAGCPNVQIVRNMEAGPNQGQWSVRYQSENNPPLQIPIPSPMSSLFDTIRDLPTRLLRSIQW